MHITLEQGNHHIPEPSPQEMQVQENNTYLSNKEKNFFFYFMEFYQRIINYIHANEI